jgi:hypothetical protein
MGSASQVDREAREPDGGPLASERGCRVGDRGDQGRDRGSWVGSSGDGAFDSGSRVGSSRACVGTSLSKVDDCGSRHRNSVTLRGRCVSCVPSSRGQVTSVGSCVRNRGARVDRSGYHPTFNRSFVCTSRGQVRRRRACVARRGAIVSRCSVVVSHRSYPWGDGVRDGHEVTASRCRSSRAESWRTAVVVVAGDFLA